MTPAEIQWIDVPVVSEIQILYLDNDLPDYNQIPHEKCLHKISLVCICEL